eukprot:gene25565-biopygen1463
MKHFTRAVKAFVWVPAQPRPVLCRPRRPGYIPPGVGAPRRPSEGEAPRRRARARRCIEWLCAGGEPKYSHIFVAGATKGMHHTRGDLLPVPVRRPHKSGAIAMTYNKPFQFGSRWNDGHIIAVQRASQRVLEIPDGLAGRQAKSDPDPSSIAGFAQTLATHSPALRAQPRSLSPRRRRPDDGAVRPVGGGAEPLLIPGITGSAVSPARATWHSLWDAHGPAPLCKERDLICP